MLGNETNLSELIVNFKQQAVEQKVGKKKSLIKNRLERLQMHKGKMELENKIECSKTKKLK